MTVAELIERLEKMPQEAEVVTSAHPVLPIVSVEWANDEWSKNYRGKVVIS